MGYDVHITRRQNCWDEEGQDIRAAGWEAVVAADLGLMEVPLWWDSGRIVSKNPSDAVIATTAEVAKTLGARVQGDDSEYYAA
ncbi:hypothetical protein [Streptomyces sp. NBC_00385]|uniref:hypothetical protein n=1 Tax=Streptomyces sp. NBC_00385 TaxID=2975733 RepID=UPI002DD82CDC|nr:hypothetical protein [Streptomyces sp. NBC_00385]WRZ08842.1 hypothetical protein OG959_38640 [Streptomyces sp. NBC_00385]